MKKYITSIAGAWSQLWNAIWGGNRDQSFSSRSYEARLTGRLWGHLAVPMIDAVFYKGHCRDAYYSDDERTYELTTRQE